MDTPMTLDTSGMETVCTKDFYYRYVCHMRRILTAGFATPQGLERNANGFLNTESAIRRMHHRYELEYSKAKP